MNYERYITVTVNFGDFSEENIKKFIEEFKRIFNKYKNSESRAFHIESCLVEMLTTNEYSLKDFEISTKYKNMGDEPFEDWEGAYDDFDFTRINLSKSLMIQYVSARNKKNLIM